MIVYRFGPDDLLRTRFAISPLLELVGAFYAARWPEAYVVHRPWARRVASGRARQLVAGGLGAAFGDLHPDIAWEGDRGLLLIPAVFSWPTPWPRTDPPWEPALVYPPAGSGSLWVGGDHSGDALESLLGAGRARLLRSLAEPGSTTELAARLGVSAGGVSDHLTVLGRAGLAARRREGTRVVSSRMALGDLLCSSARDS